MLSVVNVHLVDSSWLTSIGNAAIGLVGALIGGSVVWKTSRDQQRAATCQALDSQKQEWERARIALKDETLRAESQRSKELLSRAAGILLNALWTKERELCDALSLGKRAVQDGLKVTTGDYALDALYKIELDIYCDLISALPFVVDVELRERLRTAGVIARDCMSIRAVGQGGTVEEFDRAIIEVQRYFKWLRWNLALALQGDPLPDPAILPDVRRPLSEPGWQTPAGVPAYT